MVTIIIVAIVFWRLYRYVHRPRPAVFSKRKRWALALAQPLVDATGMTGFYSPNTLRMSDRSHQTLRTPLLHQMELRTDTTDDDARAHLARTLESRWFRADLHALLPTDDPRAALAFACVRMAFFTRSVMLMGWVESMVAWRVLLLNAQRAQDCFDSWEDFGRAFIAGRRQWVAAFRADPLGMASDEAVLQQWLASGKGAWSRLAWPGPDAFSPQPIKPSPFKVLIRMIHLWRV